MSKTIYIYGLYDPFTKKLRYIGKANDLNKRLWQHIHDAKKGQKTYKADWIRKVLKCNEVPLMGIIQETTERDWQKDEQDCIAQAKEEGAKLTNLTKGGDGLVGYSPSKETRKRLSEYNKSIGRIPPNWKGRKQSPEHIRKRVDARKANDTYGQSEKTKALISKKNTGKNLGNQHTLGYKHTEEWKEAQSNRSKGKNNAFYGKSHSDEAKAKISAAKKGLKASKETKTKMSERQRARARKGREEHIARIAISFDELITMPDDPQIKEIYRLYVMEGMTKREIGEYLGYSGTGGRFYSKMSKAIKAIPIKSRGD